MRYRHRVLSGLFFLSIITYLDRVCISVAGVRMQEDLNISPEQWGWVVGVFTLSYAAFEIPTGALGDKIGGRRILTRIVLWWSAFTALTGSVSRYWVLLLVRFLFGAGEAGAYPNISSSVSRWFPAKERAKSVGVTWMASRIGGALSPILVVPLQQAFGWRAAFFILGSVGVVWAAIWYWWYRDHPSEKAGVTQEELAEIGETPRIARHHSLPWRSVLKNSNFWLILLMYHTYCWGSYFYLSWLHTYLQKGRGFSEEQMAFWSTLPFIMGGCGNLFGGWLSDRLVPRLGLKWARRSIGAAGLMFAGFFLFGTAITSNSVTAAIFLALGYGCMDSMLPVSWAVCMDVGGNYAGAVSGAMNTAGQIGSFLSSVAFGYVVMYTGSYNVSLYPMAGMLIISSLLFLAIDATKSVISASPAPAPQPV